MMSLPLQAVPRSREGSSDCQVRCIAVFQTKGLGLMCGLPIGRSEIRQVGRPALRHIQCAIVAMMLCSAQVHSPFLEAESFANADGWLLDPQFVDVMETWGVRRGRNSTNPSPHNRRSCGGARINRTRNLRSV